MGRSARGIRGVNAPERAKAMAQDHMDAHHVLDSLEAPVVRNGKPLTLTQRLKALQEKLNEDRVQSRRREEECEKQQGG